MSRKRVSLITGIVFIGAIAWATAALAGPYVYTNWIKIPAGQQAQCMQRAEAAVRKNGFTGNFVVLGNVAVDAAVVGVSGDYTALVRCTAELGIAYIVVAGPVSNVASNYVDAVKNAF